jgi:hypothetical protein
MINILVVTTAHNLEQDLEYLLSMNIMKFEAFSLDRSQR